MQKAVSVGWGSRLHLIDGARIQNVNLTLVARDTSAADPTSPWNAAITPGNPAIWLDALYGGESSLKPGGYSNHKPGAWYFGRFYWSTHEVEDAGEFYILSWDGSGQFKHGGFTGTNGYAANWRNGRGTELISPSGTVGDISMQACAHIVHNGILFILGAAPIFSTNNSVDPWRTKEGWDVPNINTAGNDTSRRFRRRYAVFGIDKRQRSGKDHNFIRPPTLMSGGFASTQEDTNACDAISWGNDIIFASYCDLIRFPGGSGVPQLIESTIDIPTSKCFESYPSGGFINDEPQFMPGTQLPDLFVLTGSGLLKQINFPSGNGYQPSGTSILFDLGTLVTDFDTEEVDVRYSGPLERVFDAQNEPIRSCYLKSFSNQLHAFIPSETSGYHYFRCDGDPREANNWQNASRSLPDDLKRFDGDLYGFHDTFRNALYLLHVSKSDYGLWGDIGGQKGAGGMVITELSADFEFREIYRGMSAEPPMGLLPYNNLGVSVQIPSGNNPEVLASTDYALINYKIYSAYPLLVNVTIEYTIDNGLTWHPAKRFKSYDTAALLGDGLVNLTASHFGEPHTFYWDHLDDLGCNANRLAKVRITPQIVR